MGALQEEGRILPGLHQPHSLHEAWELKKKFGDNALYVSGGTLLRTQWENGIIPMPGQLIDLRRIAGMGDISLSEYHLALGALVPLSQCRKDDHLKGIAPAIQEAVRCIAAPSVRNLATVGGNIASGFGDILPALLVHDAELVSFDGKFITEQSLVDWLHSHWGGMKPLGEIIAEIRIASSGAENRVNERITFFRKVGRREAFTPSLVTVALTASIDSNLIFRNVRIAAGGGSGRPQRLYVAESMLEGTLYEEGILPELYALVESSFETYSDPFATDAYKKKMAGNLVVSELWKAMNARSALITRSTT